MSVLSTSAIGRSASTGSPSPPTGSRARCPRPPGGSGSGRRGCCSGIPTPAPRRPRTVRDQTPEAQRQRRFRRSADGQLRHAVGRLQQRRRFGLGGVRVGHRPAGHAQARERDPRSVTPAGGSPAACSSTSQNACTWAPSSERRRRPRRPQLELMRPRRTGDVAVAHRCGGGDRAAQRGRLPARARPARRPASSRPPRAAVGRRPRWSPGRPGCRPPAAWCRPRPRRRRDRAAGSAARTRRLRTVPARSRSRDVAPRHPARS